MQTRCDWWMLRMLRVLLMLLLSLAVVGLLAWLSAWLAPDARAQKGVEHEYGDAVATVVSVYDGDTLHVDVLSWPAIVGDNVGVRVAGIDTPELKDKRDEVRGKAFDARSVTVQLCEVGSQIELKRMRRDKYFRVVANVICQGKDLGAELLSLGLAKPYDGGTKTAWE